MTGRASRSRPAGGRTLIVGAGISGLAAARRARRDGDEVVVLEASDRVGGTFDTIELDGFRFEMGPNTVQGTDAVRDLVEDAGAMDGWRLAGSAGHRRYVVRRGRMVALPDKPPAVLTSPALGRIARLRLLAEPLRPRGPGPNETMGAFVRRRLGRGASHLADAMVLGIYAGDPDELTIGHAFPRLHALEREHGSLVRGLRHTAGTPRPPLIGFEGGFANLAQRLATGLDVRTGTRVLALESIPGGLRAHGRTREGDASTLDADRIVLGLPADATATLLTSLAGSEACVPIGALPHAPVAVVGLGFARGQIGHPLDGFGVLVPHVEGARILGALFTSTLFPDAAPDGKAAITVMIGGRRRPGLVDLDDDTLTTVACDALRPLLAVEGEPCCRVVKRWQPGIPQPTAASAAAVEAVDAIEEAFPGLRVLGNWRRGVGVPDCVTAGWGAS